MFATVFFPWSSVVCQGGLWPFSKKKISLVLVGHVLPVHVWIFSPVIGSLTVKGIPHFLLSVSKTLKWIKSLRYGQGHLQGPIPNQL